MWVSHSLDVSVGVLSHGPEVDALDDQDLHLGVAQVGVAHHSAEGADLVVEAGDLVASAEGVAEGVEVCEGPTSLLFSKKKIFGFTFLCVLQHLLELVGAGDVARGLEVLAVAGAHLGLIQVYYSEFPIL